MALPSIPEEWAEFRKRGEAEDLDLHEILFAYWFNPTWKKYRTDKELEFVDKHFKGLKPGWETYLPGARAAMEDIAKTFGYLPCRGFKEHSTECSETFQTICLEFENIHCPKRLLALDNQDKVYFKNKAEFYREMQLMGVPEVHINFLFQLRSGIIGIKQNQDVFLKFISWELSGKDYVLISGHTGIGKSTAAAKYLMDNAGLWLSSMDIVSRFHHQDKEVDRWKQVINTKCLVVDELGIEKDTAQGLILRILDERINRKTIFTTNLNLDQINEKYSTRFLDRIQSRGDCIFSDGQSIRQK